MEDEKLKKHFKVQLTDKRKEFNAADIKVTYELLILIKSRFIGNGYNDCSSIAPTITKLRK